MSAEIVDLSKKKEKHSFIETKNSFALEFLKKALDEKTTIQEFDEAFSKLKKNSPEKNNSSFVDNTENNSSNIEIAKDPGRALIERITNGIDSVLEDTFESRNEQNPPLTPHKAAEKWFGISEKQGIKGLSYSERMKMGKDFLLVRQLKGNDTSNQIIDVIDKGTGIDQSKFKDTILSISKSNNLLFEHKKETALLRASDAFHKGNNALLTKKFKKAITENNANSLIKNFDIIIDGSDNFKTKFLLNKISIKYNKTLIIGAISKFDGHVFTFNFNNRNEPCLKCFYQSEPSDDLLNCEREGILGPVAGIIGSLQANEALKRILQTKDYLNKKILILDTLKLNFRKVLFNKKKNCICKK